MKNTCTLMVFVMLFLFLSLNFFSCRTTQRLAEPEVPFVQYIDESLKNLIRIESRKVWTENNLMFIQLLVKNLTDEKQYVEYKFYFYDKEGRQSGDTFSYWRPLILNPQETVALNANAPNSNYTEYRVSFRKPDVIR